MKTEQQRIAIAQAMGWTDCEYVQQIGLCKGRAPDECIMQEIPEYLVDLNAIHEAEKILWEMDWGHRYIFNDHLANVLKGRSVNRNEWDAEILLDATAENRAEAFLKTLELWEEQQ